MGKDGIQRRIDAEAKAEFLAALRRGARREDAAAAAGFTLMGFYGARRRDPAFMAAWVEALAATPAAVRREGGEGGERGEVRIAAANRRLYQRRRRHVRFDAAAREAFLAHFAANCDTGAAAEAAGVHPSTVSLHCRNDPAFAQAYREALAQGYVILEAEAVRQRLAAQKRLRVVVEAGLNNPPRDGEGDHPKGGGGGPAKHAACPTCGRTADADAEFDRVMKLLARWDRKPRRAERGFAPGGRRQAWTFDRAIELLDKRLRAMGARTTPPLPPDKEAE